MRQVSKADFDMVRRENKRLNALVLELRAEIAKLKAAAPPVAATTSIADGQKVTIAGRPWAAQCDPDIPVMFDEASNTMSFRVTSDTVASIDTNAPQACNRTEVTSYERFTKGKFSETFKVRIIGPTDLWCFTQWHGVKGDDYGVGGGSPECLIGLKDGRFLFFVGSNGTRKEWAGQPILWSSWYEIRLEVDFEHGVFDVWINGNHVHSYTGPVGHGAEHYPKHGGYREHEARSTLIEIVDYKLLVNGA